MVEEVVLELVKACSSGDVQTLYYMLSQYTDPAYVVNLTSEGGVTLLMHTIIGAGERKRERERDRGQTHSPYRY